MHNNEYLITLEDPISLKFVKWGFFININGNLACTRKIKQPNVKYVKNYTRKVFHEFFNKKINMHEILKIITNLKDDTTAAFYGIGEHEILVVNGYTGYLKERILNFFP